MASNRSYRLTPRAEADLDEVWRYSFEHWSVNQADDYIRLLVEAVSELAAGARRGRPFTGRAGYRQLLVNSHIVFYRERPDHIEIIRVLHQSMDANRHL